MPAFAEEPAPIPLAVSVEGSDKAPAASAEANFVFPGHVTFLVHTTALAWIDTGSLELSLAWPEGASTGAQIVVHLRDWDFYWYQNLLPARLVPGRVNVLRVDLSPASESWRPQGHHGLWHLRARMAPKEVAIRIFSDEFSLGTCRLEQAAALPRVEHGPPWIRNVRANADRIPCFDRFELTFDLPDRYPDPFDPDKVSVTAAIKTPDGRTVSVDGFYGLDYYRETDANDEKLYPQGGPAWQVRFAPTTNGIHQYSLHVRDTLGEAHWGPASFDAVPSSHPGFVRVSVRDPRYFEFDNGAPFFPLGHNTRSPFDTRMDSQFKWAQRWPEGASVYARYFRNMRASGENVSEIWSAAWSLGLEWTERWRGYHGLGNYNMLNAWELDRVLEEAERNGIRLNVVINNHGKFSSAWDEEWADNPYNIRCGGYLSAPEQFFGDPRAMKDFRKLMRYMIARWGYSPSILSWGLFNELDLVGSSKEMRGHQPAEVVDWHRLMGRALKDMDPYDHLITTHVCQDYTHQNPAIIKLPEIDYCAVDAYHSSPESTHIVTLLKQTAQFNNPIGKPVLVTEFGGSPYAQGVKHLSESLHAALWSSTAIPLGGAPMFWWWQLIEEENLYPMYAAVNRFMQGVDRRGADLLPATPTLLVNEAAAEGIALVCMKNSSQALGWIYRSTNFDSLDPTASPPVKGVILRVDGMAPGTYQVEFWDTLAGKAVLSMSIPAKDGVLNAGLPPLVRDVAFKVRLQK